MEFRSWTDGNTGLTFDINDEGGFVYWVSDAGRDSGIRKREHIRNLSPTACRILVESGSAYPVPDDEPMPDEIITYAADVVESEFPDSDGWRYWSDPTDGMVYRLNEGLSVFVPVAFWPDMRGARFGRSGAVTDRYVFSLLARRAAGQMGMGSPTPDEMLSIWLKPMTRRGGLRGLPKSLVGIGLLAAWFLVGSWMALALMVNVGQTALGEVAGALVGIAVFCGTAWLAWRWFERTFSD